ncbi:MAG TPA: DMT family transporter [Steroidobacteraceae bacterium]|nr:DMT family transporter [Steroidobacteraceae bacterium]
MNGFVIAAVLLAACAHATWNTIVKTGGHKRFSTVMVSAAAGIIAALVLPFIRQPDAASQPFFLSSVVLQLGYYALLSAAYERGDMSHAYPLMRGTAPLLVAIVSGVFIGETVTPAHWLGIGCICGGVLGLALHRGSAPGERTATKLSLANACLIAGYTLIDGLGVRRSGAPLAYTLWIFLLTAGCQTGWQLLHEGRPFVRYLRRHWAAALVGGVGTLASYSVALWAMTRAPVALVAALRETSILFATLISVLILKERVTPQRLAATGLIAAGALALRLV